VYRAGDPLVDITDITKIEYDLEAMSTLHFGPAELYRQVVTNNTDQPQTSSISGSESVTETSGWSDALGIKVGASTSFKTGIPFIAEGKVTLSTEVSNTFTWNGSTSRTKTWGFNTPVSVPAHKTIVCLVSVTLSTISVPYTLTGTGVLKSGAKLPITVQGTYIGTNSHDLTVNFKDTTTGQLTTNAKNITKVTSKYE
jgi:hypothetical protein